MSMPAQPSSRRILVVDDDDQIRELLTTALGGDGHTVDGARDGGEALALLELRIVRKMVRVLLTATP